MKKKLAIIIISICVVIGILAVVLVKLLSKEEVPPSDTSPAITRIGIGGGGAFLNPMIDPSNPQNYYSTSDMGGLYYSHNAGVSWERTEAVGVLLHTHIANNGTIFAGNFGLYASYDQGRTLELIYPKNVKYSVSRCGWNENLMIAENYNNDSLKCVTSYGDYIYFVTLDWEGNIRLMKSDYNGNQLQILYAEETDIKYDSVSGVDCYINVDSQGVYFTMGDYINMYRFDDKEVYKIYSAYGYIRDFKIISNKFFILDDGEDESKIFYTEDWQNYTNILEFNSLPNYYDHYGMQKTFDWHFNVLDGTSMNSIFFSMRSKINETGEDMEGIMKFDGQNFHWVFDSAFNTKHNIELGWSYGGHGPIFGVYADPYNSDKVLVSTETIFEMTYTNQNTREIKSLHCISNKDGTYSTTGLDIQTTYSVKEDPFDSNHIIICTTDMGLQNSFDKGKSWARMELTSDDWSIYNTCYDLYFDAKQKDVIYGLWSSIHDAPYNPLYSYKDYTQGAFAVSYDGGRNWDFTYSSGIPKDAIPVKFSIIENETELTIAVATFNRGFYISYDTGKTFVSINDGMTTHNGLIFGEDIVLTSNEVYCLTSPIVDNGWIPAELYKYDLVNNSVEEIDLGDIVLARSLTYSKENGLYINVIPDYVDKWFVEYDNFSWVNKNGGIYRYSEGRVELVAANNNGIFHSAFNKDGKLYAVDPYGKLLVLEDDGFKVVVEGLFNILKNVSFLEDENIIYVTSFGGGTYKIDLSKI